MSTTSETPKDIAKEMNIPTETPESRRRGEYILDKSVGTVASIRVRLDRLVFILVTVSIFGLITGLNPPENGQYEISILGSKTFVLQKYFSIIIAAILTGAFTLTGSNLIDYIKKRSLLESYAKKYLSEVSPEESADILVHASFYEFMYELDIYKKDLRQPASLFLLVIFYFSHAVAIYHVFICFSIYNPIPYVISIALLGYFFALYQTFVDSTIRAKKTLGADIVSLLKKSLLFAVAVLGIILYFSL
jgi:hypothetical protein